MTNYQIGYRFELKCRDYWRHKGWSCDRTPASKSPYDLTAVRKTTAGVMVLRIQCQTHLPFARKKVRTLMDWCEQEGTHPLLQWGIGGKTKARHAVDYLMENIYKVKSIENVEVKDE